DSVAFKVAWLDTTKGLKSRVTIEQVPLSVGMGLKSYRTVAALAAGDEVTTVAPAGTVYFTPYVETFGADGVTNILPNVAVVDLTSNTLISADVSGLTARVVALESINAGPRLAALEAVTGTPSTAWFNTVAEAQAATIGVTVQRVIVFGA